MKTLAIVCLTAASVHVETQRAVEPWRQKIAAITAESDHPTKQGRRTTITQADLNAYLQYDAPAQLPAGVVEPSITIGTGGHVSARAVVDLDAVRKSKASASLLDPVSYLTGRLPVTASGVLKTDNGVGRLTLESSTVGGVPVPRLLLQEIVGYYTKTPEKPSGIGLDDPFALPARIREIQVERGQAIIVQ